MQELPDIGFKIVSTNTLKNRKCGRSTGGLAVIFKSKFRDWISVEKESQYFFHGLRLPRNYRKTEKDIHACGAYIPRHSSIYFCPELFEERESGIEKFSAFGSILRTGDLTEL